jgi:hypothetical protein
MSPTNLSAAEIALLDSQLPDIGGAIRQGKTVTPDGDCWRVGRWSFVSIRSGCGPHRSASPPAPPLWSPSPLAAHDARQGRRSRRRARSFQHSIRPRAGPVARRRRQSLSSTPTIINLKGVSGQWAR